MQEVVEGYHFMIGIYSHGYCSYNEADGAQQAWDPSVSEEIDEEKIKIKRNR